MNKYLLIFVLLLIANNSSFSQIQTTKLDSLFNALDAHDLASGSLTILKEGKVVYQKAVGFSYRFPAAQTKSITQTRYRIGSVTKMITAVMIFQLIEEKKINLDQKLSAYFPDIPNADKITITQMLSHRSGLHDYTKDTGFNNWMNKPKSKAEMLQLIREKGSDFEPDSKADYSNSNYLLLGYILEKVTGKPYEANLKDRIVLRIALKNTYVAKAINPVNNESTSYKYANGNWNSVTETDPTIHAGAGAIVSTSGDLVIFIDALFNEKLIKKSSLENMISITDEYGRGIFPYNHGSIKGYGHNGRIEEFYTALRYFPESKLSVAYITNGINFPRIDILEGVLKSCFNENPEIPFSKTCSKPDQYIGLYTAEHMPGVDITIENQKLIAKTQGAAFELEPVSENYFMHTPTGYYFDFTPSDNALRIKETDNVYYLKRK